MADSQYKFSAEQNQYFLGADLFVTDKTGHTITVNIKDGMLAVEVKDSTIFAHWPADVRDASERLTDAQGEAVYERVQHEFWLWAKDAAERYKFEGIDQVGHSGGWLAVEGTRDFEPAHLIEPVEGEEGDADLRDRFLAFAFEVERSIDEDWRPQFYEALKAAADQPTNKTLFTVTFCEQDVRDMARDVEVDPELAVKRSHECAKAITDTLTTLGNEQLREFAVLSLAAEDASLAREDEEPYWTRRCPEPLCNVLVEPEGKEEVTCSNGHAFNRNDAFAVVWGEGIPFDTPELWTNFLLDGFTADIHTEELPEGTERLDRLSDGARFEDAAGRKFWKAADGPQQGSVVITNGEQYQSWDCGLMVRPVNPKETA